MGYKTLLVEIRDHVGWLIVKRPEQHNALSWEMMQELRDFFGSLEDNLDVRVVVISGAGRDFCVGLDLKATPGFEGSIAQQEGPPSRLRPRGFMIQRKLADIPIRMRHAPQPIISSIRGAAVGGGFALALASDIRPVGDTARVNVGAPRLGMSACAA